MSLNVYLKSPEPIKTRCYECGHEYEKHESLFDANITHNLTDMAYEAGIYMHLWRPEEIGITKASELIEPLQNGVALMESDPERFKKHNPENGWGSYRDFVPWIKKYIEACKENPDALVFVSR